MMIERYKGLGDKVRQVKRYSCRMVARDFIPPGVNTLADAYATLCDINCQHELRVGTLRTLDAAARIPLIRKPKSKQS